jgi:ribosome-binding protein aMBF1 (putative translation factor)
MKMSKAKIYNSRTLDEIYDSITQDAFEKVGKQMLLAARIDDGIIAKGWRKSDFAKAMRKQPSVISKWLSGTHNFTADTLFDIETVLNIKLITLEDKPKEQITNYSPEVSSDVLNRNKNDYPKDDEV